MHVNLKLTGITHALPCINIFLIFCYIFFNLWASADNNTLISFRAQLNLQIVPFYPLIFNTGPQRFAISQTRLNLNPPKATEAQEGLRGQKTADSLFHIFDYLWKVQDWIPCRDQGSTCTCSFISPVGKSIFEGQIGLIVNTNKLWFRENPV